MTTPRISILRSGEILLNRPGSGGGGFLREEVRGCALERCAGAEAVGGVRERPLRPAAGLDFLWEAGFERVIGMAKSLYCLLREMMKPDPLIRAKNRVVKITGD